ncbi:MAG: ATP-binding protein [Vulcanimicrobiota bacterium]
MKGRQLLEPLIRLSYQRLFRTFAICYLPALLYYSLYLPEDQRILFLMGRSPVWLFSLAGSVALYSQPTYRVLTLGTLVVLMVGNALSVHQGAPCLVRIIAQAGFLLHGFLEAEQVWTFVLNGTLALFALWAEGLAGVPASPQIPMLMLFGVAHGLVWFRWRTLSRLAALLFEQGQLNQRNQQVLEVLQDCNVLLDQRVQERRSELRAAEIRLRQAYQELQQVHQQQAELQARLLEAQRMAALARFARGLSHSFSNTITCIWGCLPELKSRDPEALGDIYQACETSHRICQRMMLAGEPVQPSAQRFELNRLLAHTHSVLERAVTNPIELKAAEQDCYVAGDPAALEQLVWNLVLNAAQASRPGDPITISLDLRPGGYVLQVADCGCGIEAEVRERIFEPFFTTRPGLGNGLGLAIVRQAAEGLNASLRLHSTPGQGTRFEIELPAAETPVIQVAPPSLQEVLPPEVRRLVLVEDQDALRRLIGNFLGKQQYQVESFADAETLGDPRPGFHLLVTDVNLPGRDGVQLAQEWARANPELKILFISGYPFEASAVPIEPSRWLFLAKPFKLTELLTCVTRLSPRNS